MSKSILQDNKECFICGTTQGLQKHHIYSGSNRQISEDNGFWVYLHHSYHTTGKESVHADKEGKLNKQLKVLCQQKYEETNSRESFIELIGKSYI